MHEWGMPCDSGQTAPSWEALYQWAYMHEWGMPCDSGQIGYISIGGFVSVGLHA